MLDETFHHAERMNSSRTEGTRTYVILCVDTCTFRDQERYNIFVTFSGSQVKRGSFTLISYR